jgi:hypothetical protein
MEARLYMEKAIGRNWRQKTAYSFAVVYRCICDTNISLHFWCCKPSFCIFTYSKTLNELLKAATVKDYSEF